MNNTEQIRELRALTSAGMKDCKDALDESGGDLQKAVDIIKIKGLAISDGRSGKVAADGVVTIALYQQGAVMVEVNCQTDFVANSRGFIKFAEDVKHRLLDISMSGAMFHPDEVEVARREIVSTTKENIVVRRWWEEQAIDPSTKVFAYEHSNKKIGVLLTMTAPSEAAANDPEFKALGEDLAMQVCAMSPLAVEPNRIPAEEKARQSLIFETQLKEENKPEKMWEKILEGKFRKWNTEVCLLEQESVVVPKTAVKQVIKNVGTKLGGEIKVVNFVRCQVGEGIEKQQDDLAVEVAKMTGVPLEKGVLDNDKSRQSP